MAIKAKIGVLRAGIAGGAEHADFRFNGHGSILIQSLNRLPEQGQQRGFYRGEKVPRPKSGGTGDVFTRESAPVPCGHGGGGVVIRQTSLSWSRDIGFTRPPVNGFPPWGHTAWV